MKRILITMIALLSIVIANASKTETTTTNISNSESSITAPIYWQGWANQKGGLPKYGLYITIYRTSNQCDAYYAVASKMRYITSVGKEESSVSAELIVKTNNKGEYYVTYDSRDFYFSM